MSQKIDILSIGGAAFDVFVRAPHETVNRNGGNFIQFPLGAKIKIESVVQSCGGGATNTSVGFSRLKLHAGFCGVIGDDEWGKGIQETLRCERVDTRTAIIVEGETSSFSIILVDSATGERTILYSGNVNAHLRDPVFPKDELMRSRWIFLNHLSDVSSMIMDDLCEILLSPSIRLAWNPGGSQIKNGFDTGIERDLLRETDLLFLNKEEALAFTRAENVEEALWRAAQAGAVITCVTDGSNGAWLSDGKTVYFSNAVPSNVIDTTGAGDAFAVGVTWGVILALPLPIALKAGMINASSVVESIGTQAGLLTEIELRSRLETIDLPVVSLPLSFTSHQL